ncbi:excalibur calcium-binding domain-containing protein [Candidatus Kaiserbacteria bacterium]|nr:excalibur calcium-binding domain-containing protein [Candidatus Kaiserbacteria bacterium]
MNEIANWRKSKKARLYIIGGLLLIVVILGILFESIRAWMIGVGIVLLVALGFEVTNTDLDLGTMIEERSVSDAVIERDEEGNLETAADGGLLTRILRDKQGNEVPEGTVGAKFTDEYNCDDFATQGEAQTFFDNAGGIEGDVNRLDGNKDGVPCQALPIGAN